MLVKDWSRSVHPSVITICKESWQLCRELGELLLGYFPSWWAGAHSPHYELCLDWGDDLFGKAQYCHLLTFSCGKSIQNIILKLAEYSEGQFILNSGTLDLSITILQTLCMHIWEAKSRSLSTSPCKDQCQNHGYHPCVRSITLKKRHVFSSLAFSSFPFGHTLIMLSYKWASRRFHLGEGSVLPFTTPLLCLSHLLWNASRRQIEA